MRKLLLLLFLLISMIGYAQKYEVYSVTGKVTQVVNGKAKRISPKMTLNNASNLTLAANARIIIINHTKKQLCTIKGAAKGSLKVLLAKKGTYIKPVTDEYIAILKKSSFSTSKRSTYMQSTATSYRNIDSVPETKKEVEEVMSMEDANKRKR